MKGYKQTGIQDQSQETPSQGTEITIMLPRGAAVRGG
jgi:hypothetical protein